MLKKNVFILILTIAICCKLKAQVNKTDSIALVLEHYSQLNKSSTLFIHFDKNVYTNNDQVWFTGYMLKSIVDIDQYNTLYLSLVSTADSSVALQRKFLMDKGFAFGNFTLPDSLPGGNYRFVANANIKLNGKISPEFIQPVTIKSTTINPLLTNLSLFKANDQQTGNGTVLLKVLTSDNHFVSDAEVNYTVGKSNQILKTGKAKTSVIGEVMIDYPAGKISKDNNLITVAVKKDKYIRYGKFEIPVESEPQYQVNFYPEGGYMISGLENKIGWEVKDLENTSIRAQAIIFSGNKALDTIYTNSSGIGSFMFKPIANQKYVVRLSKEKELIGNYELPNSLNSGVNIKFNSALGDNGLRLVVESNGNNKTHLIVHNYEQIFLSTELQLAKEKPLRVLLKLDSVPTGINIITLLDSLYRPVAERIFFAHYNNLNQLLIKMDKEEYAVRDTVKLDLKILNKQDEQLKGLVSIAVVQGNRINLTNKKNIVDYNYLENILGLLPPNSSGTKYNDLAYLDDLLLIKGWRKYKWPEQSDINLPLENKVTELEYSGTVTKGKRPLKVPLAINTIAGSNVNSINTDSLGRFILPYQTIISEEKTKVWLNLNDKDFQDFNIKINDPFDDVKLALKNLSYQNESKKMGVLASDNINITSLAGIRLNEVTIKKTKDNNINFTSFGRNACGDYVCQYGILNCQNHSSGTLPVKGKTYIVNGQRVSYQGCLENIAKPNFLVLNGINYPKEFYVSDIKNTNEPINFATIYWDYQTVINETGETPLKFTTGDLTGEFKIIIQGVTDKGPVYGEKNISIRK
ncbi:hypothetical protein [Pedobacter aquatilis]|uniref:hypothetical protein n=1 Tax=Pedobacter aquatilis TaxID=351343 RepID=UPI00293031EB|nr:hypothetical protein [Pedobacter aquatilis]